MENFKIELIFLFGVIFQFSKQMYDFYVERELQNFVAKSSNCSS